MELNQDDCNGVRIVTLRGRFDAHEAPQVAAWFNEHLDTPNLVVNLEGVPFVDSTALATLVQGMKRCRERGGDLALAGMQAPVRVIFELTGLHRAFTITPAAEDAAASLLA